VDEAIGDMDEEKRGRDIFVFALNTITGIPMFFTRYLYPLLLGYDIRKGKRNR